jgi:hypothetical protein
MTGRFCGNAASLPMALASTTGQEDDSGLVLSRQKIAGWRAPPRVIQIEVIPGYTSVMKTAISLPDDTYEQATRQAHALGISRSEFFARAARSYLDQLASRSLTQQIDEALRTADDDSNAAAAAAGRRYLAGQDDW